MTSTGLVEQGASPRAAAPRIPRWSYATVADYCDSADRFPELARHQHDLKDVQRPWALKTIAQILPRGARLLEIGGGEPHVASRLADLGYDVTLCDPFDGSGNGPKEYQHFKARFPQVNFVRSYFTVDVARELGATFDCIFSISVLEHVRDDHLEHVFSATRAALASGGYSVHAIDVVLEGNGAAFHRDQVLRVMEFHHRLEGRSSDAAAREVDALLASAAQDLETFYLSPQGHNLWRGATPYEQFPFRKCISVHGIGRRPIA